MEAGDHTRPARSGFSDNWVRQEPHPRYLHFHRVAWLEGPHAGWRSGRDEVSGLQRHYPRYVDQDREDIKGHVPCIAVLPLVSIHPADDLQLFERREFCQRHDARARRAERVEPLGPCPLAVGALEIPCSDVIDASDARNRVTGGGSVRPAQRLAYNDADLSFVLDLLRRPRESNRITIGDE